MMGGWDYGTYGTYGTYRRRRLFVVPPIGPIGPIGPIVPSSHPPIQWEVTCIVSGDGAGMFGAPSTSKTGIFCCRPFSANSPRGSVWNEPMMRSRVFFEMTTCPGFATPLSRREAMFTEEPSTV